MSGVDMMTVWGGMPIICEQMEGDTREWFDPHTGNSGKTVFEYPYGYIEGIYGVDGDELDVYLGPNRQALNVYIITQMKGPDFKKIDEQKCMLGFNSAEEAKAAYLRHYNNPKFFGYMKEMPFEQFKRVAKDFNGKLIKALNAMPASATLSDTTVTRSSMSKHTDALTLLKSVTAQLEKACGQHEVVPEKPSEEDVEKGLKAAAVLSMARQARLHAYGAGQMNEGAGIGTIRIRGEHETPVVPVRRVETPIQTLAPAGSTPDTFSSCNGCGVIHKSAQPCPRCTEAHSITPSMPAWRR